MNSRPWMGVVISLLLLGCGGDTEAPPIQWPGVSAGKGASSLTVSGKAFYEDKLYNAGGFTGVIVNRPIRQAVINLIANDGHFVLSVSQTGEDGSFAFNNIDNSVRKGGVHLQLQAKNASDSASPAEVQNNITDKVLLTRVGTTLDDSVSTTTTFTNQDIIVSSTGIGGAFNILEAFLQGGAFIKKPGFCPATASTECIPPFLIAYWEPGSSKGTTFSTGSPPFISICGGGCSTSLGDTDEYDDAVILHEYGHFIAHSFSHDNSPGGPHNLGDTDQDIRLSWSEGWATFFSSSVLGDPQYVDMSTTGIISYNIESKTNPYVTNEVSNSAILWDIFDAPSPDDDPITTVAFFPIWKSFTNIPPPTPTIEEFARLFIAGNPASVNNFKTILAGRQIKFSSDAGETGESTLIVNGPSQEHTLYKTDLNPFGDEDVIPVNLNSGQKYTVKTLNLTNGADTFLTIDGLGLTNDNTNGATYPLNCDNKFNPCPKNNSTTLASSITFTPSIGGAFSVRVKRSSAAPPSTGQTGSYDIRITSP